MSQSVTFERLDATPDGHGNATSGAWVALAGLTGFPAYFRPEFGRESVEAGRLESTMLGTVSVRSCAATRGVLASDRMVFVRAPYEGMTCQIRAIKPAPDRAFIEFVVEQNVAT